MLHFFTSPTCHSFPLAPIFPQPPMSVQWSHWHCLPMLYLPSILRISHVFKPVSSIPLPTQACTARADGKWGMLQATAQIYQVSPVNLARHSHLYVLPPFCELFEHPASKLDLSAEWHRTFILQFPPSRQNDFSRNGRRQYRLRMKIRTLASYW